MIVAVALLFFDGLVAPVRAADHDPEVACDAISKVRTFLETDPRALGTVTAVGGAGFVTMGAAITTTEALVGDNLFRVHAMMDRIQLARLVRREIEHSLLGLSGLSSEAIVARFLHPGSGLARSLKHRFARVYGEAADEIAEKLIAEWRRNPGLIQQIVTNTTRGIGSAHVSIGRDDMKKVSLSIARAMKASAEEWASRSPDLKSLAAARELRSRAALKSSFWAPRVASKVLKVTGIGMMVYGTYRFFRDGRVEDLPVLGAISSTAGDGTLVSYIAARPEALFTKMSPEAACALMYQPEAGKIRQWLGDAAEAIDELRLEREAAENCALCSSPTG